MSTPTETARSDVLLVGQPAVRHGRGGVPRCGGTGLRGHVGWLPDGEVAERIELGGDAAAGGVPEEPGSRGDDGAAGRTSSSSPTGMRSGHPSRISRGIWNWRIKPGRKVRFDDLAYGALRDRVLRGVPAAARRGRRSRRACASRCRCPRRTARSTGSSRTPRSGRSCTPPTGRHPRARSQDPRDRPRRRARHPVGRRLGVRRHGHGREATSSSSGPS